MKKLNNIISNVRTSIGNFLKWYNSKHDVPIEIVTLRSKIDYGNPEKEFFQMILDEPAFENYLILNDSQSLILHQVYWNQIVLISRLCLLSVITNIL